MAFNKNKCCVIKSIRGIDKEKLQDQTYFDVCFFLQKQCRSKITVRVDK